MSVLFNDISISDPLILYLLVVLVATAVLIFSKNKTLRATLTLILIGTAVLSLFAAGLSIHNWLNPQDSIYTWSDLLH